MRRKIGILISAVRDKMQPCHHGAELQTEFVACNDTVCLGCLVQNLHEMTPDELKVVR